MFQDLFSEQAKIERIDHLLAGARRCAYKITEERHN
jgi:predicted ArsR family transcriptional regulator